MQGQIADKICESWALGGLIYQTTQCPALDTAFGSAQRSPARRSMMAPRFVRSSVKRCQSSSVQVAVNVGVLAPSTTFAMKALK